jgi:hypothetical protein
MDELFTTALATVEKKFSLQPLQVPEGLDEIKYPFKLLHIQCYNWNAEKVRKIYGMRVKIRLLALDILVLSIYPEITYDVPIFYIDVASSRNNIFAYINCIALSAEESYHLKYLEPLKPIHEKYSHFPPHAMSDWLQRYRNPYTVYTRPEKSFIGVIKDCSLDYLHAYLGIIAKAEKIKDTQYQLRIEQVPGSVPHRGVWRPGRPDCRC